MPQPATLQVTLSDEEMKFVQERIAAGEFSSESEVVATGLQRLQEEASEQERWEQEVLIPTHDYLMANPASAIPLEQVERNLEARRHQRRKAS
jgi:putative addiction module CopG family antidote